MQNTINKWHQFISERKPELLNEILAEDVVFHSPVLFTPQEGKFITSMYLMAALKVLDSETDGFQYVNEVVGEKFSVLEFVTTIDGLTINGVDMMEVNESGEVINFKVMIRPMKALHKVAEKMKEMLESFGK